ncbi:hypothetical protein P7C70_g5858, partial [Phenoliferia sp. Uapishka_3]
MSRAHLNLISQLSTLELLSSIYPSELTLSPSTTNAFPLLTSLAASTPKPSLSSQLPAELLFSILISLSDSSNQTNPPDLSITISLPLTTADPLPTFTLHQPSWLSRTAHTTFTDDLTTHLSESDDSEQDGTSYILDALEWIRDTGAQLWEEAEIARLAEDKVREQGINGKKEEGLLVRVWFWLPSLSTREKRDDIVKWAPEYGLTGFVLAGKPALLCVEGHEPSIDSYMNDIKSVSWADIPSFQKKISERHRTTLPSPSSRAFTKMEEITNQVDKGGQRGNRGEMGQVRDWLVGKGLGEAFGVVIGGGSFVS